ncbi:MAG: hypothetical protein WCV68_00750 [Candidatus Paceibacterota bacterium]|jgi:hypothetical protein
MFASKKKKESAVIGIIDIGSARVSGALMTDWPKVTNEISEAVTWQEMPNWERFQTGIEQSLKSVLKKLAHGKHKKPEELFVFLSAPFFIGSTKIVHAKDRTAFEITPPYLAGLVKKDILSFDRGQKGDLVRIENEIMQIKLDGYPVEEPIGQMAHELELSHWQSESHVSLIERFKEIIQSEFPEIQINFHSFAYASYAVFSELLPDKDWIFVDTGNELTDVIVIKDGYLAEHLSFPIGKNSLIRAVTRSLQTVPLETESVLNRYASGKTNQNLKTRLEPALVKPAEEWLSNLSESLNRVLETTILPESIYMFGDEPSDKVFADFIKKADFSAVSIGRKPFKVYYADKPLGQAINQLEGKASPPVGNNFLLAEALFCAMLKGSKLNLWPFNQLITTMHDITKNKKSLRDIFPDNKVDRADSEEVSFKTSSYTPQRSSRSTGGMNIKVKIFAGVLVLAIIIAGGFALSSQFAKITVKVVPKQGRLMVSNTYEADKLVGDNLKFSLATNIQAEDSVSVPASGVESVKTKARGRIIISNKTNSNQNLIATTRFQSQTGLIYRIEKGITVPPGQIEATVVADQAGPTYNISSADFTIPGFKGGPKYTQFSAKTKEPITGGAIGDQPKVSPAELAKATATLEKQLLLTVANKLKPQIPDGYILFDGAVVANFTPEIVNNPAKPGEATLKLKADATGLIFDEKELASFLAKQQVPDYKGEPVKVTNWSTFKFSLINNDNSDLSTASKISFKLEGTGQLVWLFDTKDLKQKLQASGASNYKTVFTKDFPMIQTASIVFTPPWTRSIPSDPNRILVETNVSKP